MTPILATYSLDIGYAKGKSISGAGRFELKLFCEMVCLIGPNEAENHIMRGHFGVQKSLSER